MDSAETDGEVLVLFRELDVAKVSFCTSVWHPIKLVEILKRFVYCHSGIPMSG
jgi:hypothetical protein